MNTSLNPFVLGLLAMLVRQALLTLIGAMGLTPLIQPYLDANMTQFTQFSLAVAGGLGIVGYAIWRKVFEQKKLVQALAEAGTSEKAIEQMVKSPTVATPSVLSVKTQVPY